MTASEFYDEFGIPAPLGNIDETAARIRASITLRRIAMALIRKMNSEEREKFLLDFRSEFCIHCGSDSRPCYCMRDD